MTTSVLQAVMMTTFSNLIYLFFLLGVRIGATSFKLDKRNKSHNSDDTWVSLCDKGHRYLFSEYIYGEPDLVDWAYAKLKCGYLGGYLVRIENRHENNCILVHAQKEGLHHYWWTSGLIKNKIYLRKISYK